MCSAFPKMFVSAGESSGDLYSAEIIRLLCSRFPQLQVAALAGTHCLKAGAVLIADTTSVATMGFWEVLPSLPQWKNIWDKARRWILHNQPSVVLCVDNPGFNMRFARFCHEQNIPVVYLAPPQVWAWGKRRAPRLAKMADLILTLFPWEEKQFTPFGGNVQWVGHPATQLVPLTKNSQKVSPKNTVAILPGSRVREVRSILPVLGKGIGPIITADKEVRGVVVWASSGLRGAFEGEALRWGFSSMDHEALYEVLQNSILCITCSGTVTLEVALAGVPQLIVYRLSPLTFWLASRVYRGQFVGLPNLVAERSVSPELIQKNFTPRKVASYVEASLNSTHLEKEAENTAYLLRRKLSNGNCFEQAAHAITQYLSF